MSARTTQLLGIAAFVRKELAEILRQPRLVVSLILGPFVILALFGFGYQRTAQPLATLFVADRNSQFASQIEQRAGAFEIEGQASAFEGEIDFRGITESLDDAVRSLRDGEVDLVVVVPDQPVETVRAGQQAVFRVLHDQLDPFEQAAITLITRTTVDGVNRQVLEELVAVGQEETAGLEQLLPAAADTASAMRSALEAGNTSEALRQRRLLTAQLREIENRIGSTEVVVAGIRTEFEQDGVEQSIVEQIKSLEERVEGLDLIDAGGRPIDAEIEQVREIETDIEALAETLAEFRRVDPEILVSPFAAQADVVSPVDLELTDFYAPGVIALLLQHLAVTIAGLSLVRERDLGTPEVFRVAPLRSISILAGKYIGYLVASVVVAGALSVLMFSVFGVPLVGSLWNYLAILVLLVLTSLGLGFVISAIARSDIQAVNAALILLLLSIFFSGFFLSLERLTPAIRGVSWVLPITHGLDSLRDVMFRGAAVDGRTWLALGGGTLLLFGLSAVLFRRRLGVR